MAIKNTSLGGSDWVANTYLTSSDLNDTFNAAFSKIKTLSTFWANSDLRSTAEDFSSFSVGTLVAVSTLASTSLVQGNYTFGASCVGSGSASGYSASVAIANNSYSATSGKDLVLLATGSTASFALTAKASITIANFFNNKHVYIPLKATAINNGGNYNRAAYTIYCNGSSLINRVLPCHVSLNTDYYHSILFIAKGSNIYDVYCGDLKTNSNLTLTSNTLTIEAEGSYEDSNMQLVIPEIYTSASTIS